MARVTQAGLNDSFDRARKCGLDVGTAGPDASGNSSKDKGAAAVVPSAFATARGFQQCCGRGHPDRWLSERHAFSLLRAVLALRGFVMGRDNIGADDDPAVSGPLRHVAPGARILTADDEANPDALAIYDGALGDATSEQHSIASMPPTGANLNKVRP